MNNRYFSKLFTKTIFITTGLLIFFAPTQKALFGFNADEEELEAFDVSTVTHHQNQTLNQQHQAQNNLTQTHTSSPQTTTVNNLTNQSQQASATYEINSSSAAYHDEINPSQTNRTRFSGHVEIAQDKILRVSTISPYSDDETITRTGQNLVVTGNLTVDGTSSLLLSTNVAGGTFSVGSSKMTVDSATGNTVIAGTASIAGNTTMSSNASIGGNATVTGNSTISGNAIVTGTSTHGNSILLSSGSLLVNTNKMTVDSATGNTVIAGTASIAGNTTMSSNASIGGNATVSGNTTISGTTTLGNGLTITDGALVINDGSNPFFTVDNDANQITISAAGLSYLVGEKSLSTISSTPTSVLTLNFTNLLGSVTTIAQGVQVKLRCFVSGTVSGVQTETLYESNLYVLPGSSSGNNCSIVKISESSATSLGSVVTIASQINGTGTAATIQLTNSSTYSQQTAVLFYEVTGSNITSVS